MKYLLTKMAKLFSLTVIVLFLCTRTHFAEDIPPERYTNIIVFLVDNLGTGDLGCYGATSQLTPNIDKLSEGGVTFTRWYSQSSGVASRASILTGLLPTRTGMIRSSFLPFETFPSLASTGGLRRKEITLAEVLKTRDFSTAFIGHWGLGLGRKGCYLPIHQGFDYWYGVPNIHTEWCQQRDSSNSDQEKGLLSFLSSFFLLWTTSLLGAGLILWYIGKVNWKLFVGFVTISGLTVYLTYICFFMIDFVRLRGCVLYRNADIIEQPYGTQNMTLRFTREAVKFIKASLDSDTTKPFFLFLSFMKMHPPFYVSGMFQRNHTNSSAEVGNSHFLEALTELDWSVGKIMDVIHNLGMDEDTLVVFTSTHGALSEEHLGNETKRKAGIVTNQYGEQVHLKGL